MEVIDVPYVLCYLVAELAAMNIRVKVGVKSRTGRVHQCTCTHGHVYTPHMMQRALACYTSVLVGTYAES